MFADTVTIFNLTEDIWNGTVLHSVEVQASLSEQKSKDANKADNEAILFINIDSEIEKKYRKPIAYQKETDKVSMFTLTTGDFFVCGEYPGSWNDTEYENGFFEHMKSNYDDVFEICSVKQFKTLPHFEVGGK